jgi:drug/metabolite transporter (DMT)-like permease
MSGLDSQRRGAGVGLLAALLFGLSAPLSKLLLPACGPVALAGLLYLGGGAGLTLVGLLRRRPAEAPLQRSDAGLLIGIIVIGGIIGPLLLMLGLQRLTGVVASMLLNLEAPFTMLLAVLLFREHLSWKEVGAAGLILLGGATVGLRPGELRVDGWGIAALAGACLSWGLDNNLTQRLSVRDPIAVVRVKGLSAGSCSILLAWASGAKLPALSVLAGALVVGLVSYGFSIVLDVYALRLLGAAREAAFFATAPFMGAVASVFLLGERLTPFDLISGGVMAAGVAGLMWARHDHWHQHDPLEHDHVHVHDEHHPHSHAGPAIEPHAHPHEHAPIAHDHPHVSDVHHRHRHP